MIMGQIGEYRELSLEELRERFGQEARDIQALELQAQKERAKPLAEMFAELLGSLDTALYWLHKVDLQFPEDNDEQCDNPFWGAIEVARKPLEHILADLSGVEKDMPREQEAPV